MIHRRAKRAFEARQLDFLRPHDARHCFGTYMGFTGVPSHTLRLVIVHTSIKTTDRYRGSCSRGRLRTRTITDGSDQNAQMADRHDLPGKSRNPAR
jgi:integrase